MAALATIELSGMDAVLEAFKRAPDMVREELLRAATTVDLWLLGEVKEAMPTATGLTRASLFHRETALPEGAIGVVASAQPHVVYVELGTKPHWPNMQALRDWVRIKFGLTEEKEIRSVAYLVGRKISLRGTEAVHVFKNAATAAQPMIDQVASRMMQRIARRLAEGV